MYRRRRIGGAGSSLSRKLATCLSPHRAFVEKLEARLLLSNTAEAYTWQNAVIGAGGFVDGVFFDPNQKNVAYARTDIGGFYKSTDGGTTWKQLLDFVGNTQGTSGNNTNQEMLGVMSFAQDPENSNNIYLDTGQYSFQNGWVLSSHDGGQTFSITNLPFSVGGNSNGRGEGERLAVDPNQGNILFLGSDATSGTVGTADGLWISTNSGASFTQDTSFPATPGSDGITFVTFDPTTGTPGSATQTIYVGVDSTAAGTNIYRSTNGGTTWAELPAGPTGLIPQQGKFASNGIMYFTFANAEAPNGNLTTGAVWRYITSSGTWANISPVTPGAISGDTFGYDGLSVDPENPTDIVVTSFDRYALGDTIWHTSNANSSAPTWVALFQFQGYGGFNTTRTTTAAPWVAAFDDGIGNWAASVAIDPFNSAHLIYGNGQGLWGTNNALSTTTLTAANSWYFTDTGIDFTAVGTVAAPPSGVPLYSAMGDINGFAHTTLTSSPAAGATTLAGGTGIGSENGIDFAFDNPAFAAYVGSVGNDDGAFTTNDGLTWTEFKSKPSGASSGTIAVAADGSRLVWSPSGKAAYWSTNDGTTWTLATGGLPTGGKILADRVNPSDFYYYTATRIYVSTNGGVSFTAVGGTFTGISDVAVNPFVTGDIWITASAGLFHSTNSGATVTRIAANSIPSANLVALGAPAPGQAYPAVYIFATIGGFLGMYRSDDAGATWIQINDTAHQWGGLLQTLAADPNDFGRVYIGTNGRGVLVGNPTSSLPATWTDQDINIPGNPGYAFSSITLSNGTIDNQWTVEGGGAGITSTSDQFNLASKSVSGNIAVETKLSSLSNAGAGTPQAGLMIRASANASDPFAALLQTTGNQLIFESRSTSGGAITSTLLSGIPIGAEEIELVRSGSNFSGYYSSDGVDWSQIGSTVTISAIPSTANVGLAVTSNFNAQLSTAIFSNVTIGQAPSIVTPASANPNPTTTDTTQLSVLGADTGGESDLTYTWASSGPASVLFSTNGSNSAKNTTATFPQAGVYIFTVTAVNPAGLVAVSTVSVSLTAAPTSITVTPSSVGLNEDGTQQFTAVGYDQFNNPLASQPSFTWSLGPGSIGSINAATGSYSAPPGEGTATVIATAGSVTANASVTVTNAAPTVAVDAAANPNPVDGTTTDLSVQGADDAGPANLTYVWSSTGPAPVTFSVNGSNSTNDTTATFTQPGEYQFTVQIIDDGGLSTTSTCSVDVETVISISVQPANNSIPINSPQQFTATAVDQFGNVFSNPAFAWSITGNGNSIDNTGLATLGATADIYTVTAAFDGFQGSTTITTQPIITSYIVNDGNPQRSMVTSLTVVFNQPVTLGLGAISLNQRNPVNGAPAPQTFTLANPSGDQMTYVLTFTDSNYIGGSLPDGVYDLTIHAAQVTDSAGTTLAGGDQTFSFYRLYGDYYGTGTVGFADLVLLAQDFDATSGDPDYIPYMDIDGDGLVGFAELVKLAQNFDDTLSVSSFPAAPPLHTQPAAADATTPAIANTYAPPSFNITLGNTPGDDSLASPPVQLQSSAGTL